MSAQAASKEEREEIRKKIEALLMTEQPQENNPAKPESFFEAGAPAAATSMASVPEASTSARSAPEASAATFSSSMTSTSVGPTSLFSSLAASTPASPAPSFSSSMASTSVSATSSFSSLAGTTPVSAAPSFSSPASSVRASSALRFSPPIDSAAKRPVASSAAPATFASAIKSFLFAPPSQVEAKRLKDAIDSSRSKGQLTFHSNALPSSPASYTQPKANISSFPSAPACSRQPEASIGSLSVSPSYSARTKSNVSTFPSAPAYSGQPEASIGSLSLSPSYFAQPESNVSTFPSSPASASLECDADALASSFSMALNPEMETHSAQEEPFLPPLGNADGDIGRRSTINNGTDLPRFFQEHAHSESALSGSITSPQPAATGDSQMGAQPLLAGSPSTPPLSDHSDGLQITFPLQPPETASTAQLSKLQFDLNLV